MSQDIYYLETILRRLREFKSILPDKVMPTLGNEALADEIDWLDCYIARIKTTP